MNNIGKVKYLDSRYDSLVFIQNQDCLGHFAVNLRAWIEKSKQKLLMEQSKCSKYTIQNQDHIHMTPVRRCIPCF